MEVEKGTKKPFYIPTIKIKFSLILAIMESEWCGNAFNRFSSFNYKILHFSPFHHDWISIWTENKSGKMCIRMLQLGKLSKIFSGWVSLLDGIWPAYGKIRRKKQSIGVECGEYVHMKV